MIGRIGCLALFAIGLIALIAAIVVLFRTNPEVAVGLLFIVVLVALITR